MLKKTLVSLLVGISIVGLVGCSNTNEGFKEKRKQVQEERLAKEQEEQLKEENYEEVYKLLKGCVDGKEKWTIERKDNEIYLKLNIKETSKLTDIYNSGWTYEEIENKFGTDKDAIDDLLDTCKTKVGGYGVVVVCEISYSGETAYKKDTNGNIIVDVFKELKEKEEEEIKEAKDDSHIGEIIQLKQKGFNPGTFNLTIDNVYITEERNQFADPVKFVVVIEYTVENVDIDDLDLFLDNRANFYDSNGYKCGTYPNVNDKGTYDIDKGMKAKGQISIGIKDSDTPYLEMKLSGIDYKWNL